MSNNFYKIEKQTGFEKIEHIEIRQPVKIIIIPYFRKTLNDPVLTLIPLPTLKRQKLHS